MVIIDIDRKLVAHKNEVCGEGVWVIMFCDNISAHLYPEVKKIFGINMVFLLYLPPNMKTFIESVDAGLGRSARLAVERLLDEWIMDSDNMTVWEGGNDFM